MADDRIEIEVVLDDGSIQKGFAKIRQEGSKTEKSLSKNFTRALRSDISKPFDVAKSSVFNLRNAVVGLTAVLGGGAFLRSVTQAAAQQEEAVNSLNVSLQTAGTFSKEASESFQELASELQSQSRFGDEVILQQAALARNYARTNEETEKLIKASIDLSEATGMSLDSAVRNLGKTFSGLTGELGEAIPQVRGLTAEQLKAGAAIDVIAQRFGGAAQGAIRTFAGATAQLSNTFGDLLEAIGSTITSSPQVIAFINALSKTFGTLIKNLSGSGEGFDQFFKNLVINGAAAANALIDSFSALAQIPTFIQFTFTQVQIAILEGINFILSGLGSIGNVISKLIGSSVRFGDTVQANLEKIASLTGDLDSLAAAGVNIDNSFNLARQTVDGFTSTFQELSVASNQSAAAIGNFANTTVDTVDPALRRLRDKISGIQDQIRDSVKGNIFDLVTANKELFADTSKLTAEQLKQLQNNLDQFKQTTLQTATEISNGVQNGLGRAFSSGIQSAVKALQAGQNAFQAFGTAFLSTIGDLAIQLGTFILTGSLGLSNLFAGNPAGGIAFGAALIAIGTLLSSLNTGGFEAAGVGPGQDAVTSPILDDGISDNLQEPGASVQVNIEGNVFDSEDTGLRIADILKDQGFNNAVVS